MEDRHPPNSDSSLTETGPQCHQSTSFTSICESTKLNDSRLNPNQYIYKLEDISFKEWFKGCLIAHPKACLFALVGVVYLVAAVIHFFGWTGDTSMLDTIFKVVVGYNGLTELTATRAKALTSKGTKGGHDQGPLKGK